MSRRILITGGAGFIGSALIRYIIRTTQDQVINIDKLTYAGNLFSLQAIENHPNYVFHQVDICDKVTLEHIFHTYQPDTIMHLAAESHVDRSIHRADTFIQTNIIGTYTLLETARHYWYTLTKTAQSNFRFHHISTDEVYGDLGQNGGFFTETSPYSPHSPYSASKASSDHLVRAWYRTYGLPTLISHCSNNYGAFQYPEKLIPLMITNALSGKTLPIYGDGLQVRDWIFVEDHIKALYKVVSEGKIGETYNIGGQSEKTNLEVVHTICQLLEELHPNKPKGVEKYRDLITYVEDRAGHDQRYAIDSRKIQTELHWQPQETFESGIRKTVIWYLNHHQWWQEILHQKDQFNN